MTEQILNTIRKYQLIEEGENVVVGFSGGPDSVCLLHVLHVLSGQLGIKLYAVHINHMLRASESDEDEAYAREFCKKLGVELHVRAFDIRSLAREKRISEEETGREVRYGEFNFVAQRLGKAKIAVAHNRNDQAETVFMRLVRGTGTDGLCGMKHKRDSIIRPLLDTGREEIEKYCEEQGLNPKIDSSNLKSIYTRNKIRLEIIPYINREFDIDIVENLYRMSQIIGDDVEIIDSVVGQAYDACVENTDKGCLKIRLAPFRLLKAGVAKRVVRSAVRKVKGDINGIDAGHIESVVSLVEYGRTGSEIQLPHGLRAVKSYEEVKIYIEAEKEDWTFFAPVEIGGITRLDGRQAYLESEVFEMLGEYKDYMRPDSSMEQFFDYEKLIEGINIRSREDGDFFKPLKALGTKKLKKYFIDKKIPRDRRDRILLIAKNKEIVWIIGYKTSDNFKITENTRRVIKLKYNSGACCS